MRLLILLLLFTLPAFAQTVVPAPGSTVPNGQPAVTATFQVPLRSVRLIVDGQDLSNQARLMSNQVLWNPYAPLAPGQHQVQIEAINMVGVTERANWSFIVGGTTQPAAGPRTPTAYIPTPGTVVNTQRPLLQVDYPESITSARLILDNQDYTNQVALQGTRAVLQPMSDLPVGQHIGRTSAVGVSGQNYEGSWMFTIQAAANTIPPPPPPPPPGGMAPTGSLTNYSPPPNAQVPTNRPYVSADFPQPVSNARMIVDGVDVSNQAERTGTRISWSPQSRLQPGTHNVAVDGTGPNGQVLSGNWSFTTTQGGGGGGRGQYPTPTPTPMVVPIQILMPGNGQRVNRTFNVRVQAAPGALIRVTLRDLTTQRSKTYQDRAGGKGSLDLRIDAGWTLPISRLQVTATAIDPTNSQPVGQPMTITVSRI